MFTELRNKKDVKTGKKQKGYELTLYRTDAAWAAAIIAAFIVCLELFYRMIVDYNGKYESDMHYYAVSNVTSGEPHDRFLGVLFQFFYDINQTTLEINIYLAAVICAIIIVNFLVIRYYLKDDGMLDKVPRPVRQFFSVATLFIGPIYVPVLHEWYYRKSFESFAWHSPTQQSMTLFAMIASICFLRMYLRHEERGVKPLDWTAAMLTVLLATTVKPSFTMNLMAAVVVMFIVDLIRGGKDGVLKRFRNLFIMGCSLIPSGLYMIWLHTHEFTNSTQHGEEHKVIFDFAHTLNYEHLWAAILFGMTFPIVVAVFNTERFRDPKYRFALYIFVMGVLQWAFITETGKRGNYGNFGWGRVYGTYFITLVSTVIAMEAYYNENSKFAKNKKLRNIFFILLGIVLAASILSQLNYFRLILTGHGYMH